MISRLVNIILFAAAMLACNYSYSQILMHGRVFAKNESLVGAMLLVKGSGVAALSDATGNYTLSVPEQYASGEVVVSYAGYPHRTIKVASGRVDVELFERQEQYVTIVDVSTQKRIQQEVDVPIAMSVMPGNKQNDFNLSQIDEMSFFVPGLQASIQDYSTCVYGIRGVVSDGVESYFHQRISVYLDNVSIGRLQTSIIEPFDMQRVEVIKGPQGTLFGSGALAGAVHYIRNQPQKEFGLQAMAGCGLYNQRTGEAVLNAPLGAKVANRAGFRYDAHDGYTNNLAGGRAGGKSAFAIRNATSFFLKDSSHTITLSLDWIHNNNSATCFKTSSLGLPDSPGDTSPYTDVFMNGGSDLGLHRNACFGILKYEGSIGSNLGITNVFGYRYFDYDFMFDADGSYINILLAEDYGKGHQISDEIRLNWDNKKNLSGFVGASLIMESGRHCYLFGGDMKQTFPIVVGPKIREQLDIVPPMVAEGVVGVFDKLGEQVSQANPAIAGMVSSIIDNFKPLAREGVINNVNKLYDRLYLQGSNWEATPDIIHETSECLVSFLSKYVGDVMVSNPDLGALLSSLMGGASVEDFIRNFNLEGLLGQNPVLQSISNVKMPENYSEDATDRCKSREIGVFADLTWNFSPRFYLTLGLRGISEAMETGYLSNSMAAPLVNQSLMLTSSNGEQLWTRHDYLSWAGRAIVNWKFTDKHNLYASVSRGRRPAQVYFDLRPDVVVELRPERLYNFEAGIKGMSEHNIIVYNASAYYYAWQNFQSMELGARSDGYYGYITNDKGRARGFGLDGQFQYNFSPSLNAFMGYAFCNGRFCKKDMDGNDQELAGNRFRMNPEHKFNMGVNFSRKFKKGVAHVHPLLAVVGKFYFSDLNPDYLKQSAFAICNLNAGYTWKSRGGAATYDVSLYGKNLFNSKYCVDGGNAGDAMGLPTYVPGAPLTFGAVLRVSLSRI